MRFVAAARLFPSLLLLPTLASAQLASSTTAVEARYQLALEAISASSMRGNLSFLASDLLEGRGTPSRGLDLAAEFIAAHFRKAGLEPIGDDGYFQTTTWRDTGLKVRNVAGLLRGSDPVLRNSYVIVSAHYDHLGMRTEGEGDRIFNGANDDGSGTVSVIELAGALSKLAVKPKRSILFLCFYGEEKGLVGSRYYGNNPLVPIEKTIAMVNLEHMGRTDDEEGNHLKEMVMTGFDYSEVGSIFATAGKPVGINVRKHPQFSDAFFGRSDNQALADLGVPSHTVCTAFIFPEYHKAGDHWEKVDFENMASVNRAVALGVLAIAESAAAPRWNEANPKAAKYVAAWKARQPKP